MECKYDLSLIHILTVIAFKDDEGNEKYKLVDGERRYRATMLAISEGADIPLSLIHI